jgi:hypothetical protein
MDSFLVKDFFEIMMGNFKETKYDADDETDQQSSVCLEIKIKDLPCTSFLPLENELQKSILVDPKTIILEPTDYILSAKSQIKGYSMIPNENLFAKNDKLMPALVVNSNFIIMRILPTHRLSLGVYGVQFLHFILDRLIQKRKADYYDPKKPKHLTLTEVANLKISTATVNFFLQRQAELVDLFINLNNNNIHLNKIAIELEFNATK